MSMYCITRRGERIAGSLAIPYDAAKIAAQLLNREYRRREFDVEPDPTCTVWEELQVPRLLEMAACVSGRTC